MAPVVNDLVTSPRASPGPIWSINSDLFALTIRSASEDARGSFTSAADRTAKDPSRSIMKSASRVNLPFPPVFLKPYQQAEFQATIRELVRDHVLQFEAFLPQLYMLEVPRLWECIDTTSDFQVYRQRPEEVVEPVTTNSNGDLTPTRDENVKATTSTSPKPPLPFVAIGRIPGTVEDALYGLMTPTTSALQMRNDLWPDGTVDGAVLASVVSPTTETPLTCTSVNWCVRAMSKPWRLVTHKRDSVFLDATGFHKTSTGETVGYHVQHSIDLHQCPPNHQRRVVRESMSKCCIFRQDSESKNCVQVFMKANPQMESQGPTGLWTRPWPIRGVAQAFMAYSKASRCGQVKQLTSLMPRDRLWLLGQASRCRLSKGTCWICEREPTMWHVWSRRAPRTCKLCTRVVCAHCCSTRQAGSFSCRLERFCFQQETFCLCCLDTISRDLDATTMSKVSCRSMAVASTLQEASSYVQSYSAHPIGSCFSSNRTWLRGRNNSYSLSRSREL